MSNEKKVNDVIALLFERQGEEHDPVKYAQIGEAIWVLRELKSGMEKPPTVKPGV